jgi:hypothetical protein
MPLSPGGGYRMQPTQPALHAPIATLALSALGSRLATFALYACSASHRRSTIP